MVSYPYVDFNTTYTLDLSNPVDNNTLVWINITNPDGTNATFNFTYTTHFTLSLLFTEIGDYPFIISSANSLTAKYGEFIGTFLVRQPYNVTFCGFNQDDNYDPYINNYAYLIAEFTSSKQHYNPQLEQFITPLGFATTFTTPVFHTLYRDGCGTFKLYEPNEEYAVRLFDGVATFETTFSPPNISKAYGTNIYFGEYILDGTENYNVLLTDKDIHQYRWLLNWLFLISILLAIVGSVFLFFVIPEMPTLSIIFGIGFISMITLLRIVLWFWLRW